MSAGAAHRTMPLRTVRPTVMWSAAAAFLIVAGFAGLDNWFYQRVALQLDDASRPLAADFHMLTRPFWIAVRFMFASFYAAVFLTVLATILDERRWLRYLLALGVVAAVGLFGNVLQGAIGRARPNQAASPLTFVPPLSQIWNKQGVCFPSGEATMAFAIASLGARFVPRWAFAFLTAAGVAALSRLVNGAHYPSDVAAGALLGFWLSRWLYDRLIEALSRARPSPSSIQCASD